MGIAHTTTDGRILEANAKLCQMLGYTAAEMLLRTTRDLTHPDDRDRHNGLRLQLLARKHDHFAAEKRYLRKDGDFIWVKRVVTLARDAANEAPYLIQVMEDITDRKIAEIQVERLRRAREVTAACHRILIHATDETSMLREMCRVAVETGGYPQVWIGLVTDDAKCPVRVAAHAGYREGAPLPMTSPSMYAADGCYIGKMSEVVTTGMPRSEQNLSTDAPDPDQRVLAVKLGRESSLALPLISEDKILGGLEFNAAENDAFDSDEIALLGELAADIAFGLSALRARRARQSAETQLRAQKLEFQSTFENAPVGIMHTALDSDRILRANDKLSEMLGYTRDQLLTMTSTDITHPSHRFPDKGQYYEQMLRGELPSMASERKFVRKDGSTFWVNRIVSLARDASGKPAYFIRIIEDITERKLSAHRRDMEHAVTAVLAESPTLAVAMPRLIRILCEGLGWACGMHWSWDQSTELLRCADFWHTDCEQVEAFVAASRSTVNEAPAWVGKAPGTTTSGLVRNVWLSGAPVWFADVARRPGFRRGQIAAEANLHCAFGFPVLAGERPLGVMEFYSRAIREPDEALLRVVQAIGQQLGQFIQRKLAEDAQHTSEERYRDMFDSSPLPMWVWDDETLNILTVNQAAIDHYGYSRDEFQRMNLRDLWVLGETASRERNIRDRLSSQTMYLQSVHVTKDRRTIAVEVNARAFKLGARAVWLTLLNDVTERLRVEEKLLHLAHYDTLTDLPNRVLFYDRLKQALAQAKRNAWITGVMFMDLDRFKNINDTLGHAVGDQLLRQVSERLLRSVRSADTVGRLGGDEFGIVLANLCDATAAGHVAKKIIALFDLPFRLEGAEIYVTPSVGITLYPQDGTEQDALIKYADAAMYHAKKSGRNTYKYYSPKLNARGLALLNLEGSLRRALENDEFLLHYQPKATLATGAITGLEALVRWQRPAHGLVSPAEFIPVLEETGLIVQVGEWVLNAVCAQINAWRHAGLKPVPVAVNLSARQFLQPNLGTDIRRILATHQVDPALIELEITESSLMSDPQEATRTLEYLKQLGVAISVDDFGTGYSSLSYLKRFPLDALKIDRSFVRDITTDANDAAITLAVISMAHSLGLTVVAEGVETQEQLAFLALHDCDQIQGYYLAKPLPAEECARVIAGDRRLRSVEHAAQTP